jgi:4-amino-4-deoxy-L-arabinose transferase-like glycosyltransferase
MSRAGYFRYLFVEHDLTRPEWGDSFETHTHPMLTNYIVGGWLWFRGYELGDMPHPYDYYKDRPGNHREGRIPDDALLADGRAPMVFLATGMVGLLYLLGRIVGGIIAGLAAAALALGSPLVRESLVRALSEAPLTFFLFLALLLAVLGGRRGRANRLPLGWAVAVGAAAGLAFATKLTAVLSLAAILGWMALAVVLAIGRSEALGIRGRLRAAWQAGQGWVLALLVALGVFVLSNPHLYPNPFLHTAHLFQQRSEEMVGQRFGPNYTQAIDNPLKRPFYVLGRSLIDYTLTGSHGLPLEVALAGTGAFALLMRTWRGWRQHGQLPAEGLVLLTALTYVAGISAGMLIARIPYFVPTLLLGILMSGLGLSALISLLPSINGALKARCPVTQETAPST